VKINNLKLMDMPFDLAEMALTSLKEGAFKMAVVPIVSGDIDSLVMCKILNNEMQEQHPIFIDFGQISNEEEWESCRNVFKRCNLPPPEKIDLSGYCRSIESDVNGDCKASYINAFLPGRNLMSLMAAASYAYQRGIKIIAIALLSEKIQPFPDQTEEFLVNANFAINSAFGDYITILTPLINFTKSDIINIAKWYGLPIEDTFCCHPGRNGICKNCTARKAVVDPIEVD
jgi:7-cyano-7-deazaguanine synthase